ncbi:MAG: serine/threonine protein phosphatase PrpC [Pseudohongiellaceae bacterium]|jgi:serine/threonine protein phosphatase PrpC
MVNFTLNYKMEFLKSSDVGLVRSLNEDNADFDKDHYIFALADGMGGHQAGEIASAMAVDLTMKALKAYALTLDNKAKSSELSGALIKIIEDSNQAIYAAGLRNSGHKGMGTTIVIGLFYNKFVYYAHVGDSRFYLFRNLLLNPLTQDHTLLQEMINKAPEKEREFHATIHSNIVTQALGVRDVLSVSTDSCEVMSGDIFLCTTDGVHDAMNHQDLEKTIQQATEKNNTQIIIDTSNEKSGKDNATVIMIKTQAENKWLSWLKRSIA